MGNMQLVRCVYCDHFGERYQHAIGLDYIRSKIKQCQLITLQTRTFMYMSYENRNTCTCKCIIMIVNTDTGILVKVTSNGHLDVGTCKCIS